MDNYIKKEACTEASPFENKNVNYYAFFIKDGINLNIKAMIDMVKDQINNYSLKNNQELISDIEIRFNCETAIGAKYGREELCFETHFTTVQST